MVDGLLLWWNENKQHFSAVTNLVVNMDNGLECSVRRSQFLLRMIEFADMTQFIIRLTYNPPYHSKYNAIERYWAGLERSWNGYLLDNYSHCFEQHRQFCLERSSGHCEPYGFHL